MYFFIPRTHDRLANMPGMLLFFPAYTDVRIYILPTQKKFENRKDEFLYLLFYLFRCVLETQMLWMIDIQHSRRDKLWLRIKMCFTPKM